MDLLLRPVSYEELGAVKMEDLVTWRSDGETFKGTEEQRAAVKQVSDRDVSVDPQPQQETTKKAEEQRLEQADRLNRFVKMQLATSADEEDRSPRAPGSGKPGPGIRKTSCPPNDAKESHGQVEQSKKTARNQQVQRHLS